MTQAEKQLSPPVPRRDLAGFKRIPDALRKRFAADDATLAGIRRRLDHLERGMKSEARR